MADLSDQGPIIPSLASQTSEFEPDERWKKELRGRIESNLAGMVEKAKADLAKRLKQRESAYDESSIRENHQKIMADLRRMAQEQYHVALERERQERKWAAEQQLDGALSEDMIKEQQAILDAIKRNASQLTNSPPVRNEDNVAVPRRVSQRDSSTAADSAIRERTRKSSNPQSEFAPEDIPRPPRSSLEDRDSSRTSGNYSVRREGSIRDRSGSTESPPKPKPEIWVPGAASSKEGPTSRTLAHASGTFSTKPRRDSSASIGNTNSIPATIPEHESDFSHKPDRDQLRTQENETAWSGITRSRQKARQGSGASDDRINTNQFFDARRSEEHAVKASPISTVTTPISPFNASDASSRYPTPITPNRPNVTARRSFTDEARQAQPSPSPRPWYPPRASEPKPIKTKRSFREEDPGFPFQPSPGSARWDPKDSPENRVHPSVSASPQDDVSRSWKPPSLRSRSSLNSLRFRNAALMSPRTETYPENSGSESESENEMEWRQRLEDEFSLRESQAKKMEEEVTRKREEAAKKELQLREQEQQIRLKEAEMKRKQDEFLQKQAEAEEKAAAELRAREAEIQRKQEEFLQMQAEAEEKAALAKQLELEAQERAAEIEAKQQEIRLKEIEAQEKAAAALQREDEARRLALEAMEIARKKEEAAQKLEEEAREKAAAALKQEEAAKQLETEALERAKAEAARLEEEAKERIRLKEEEIKRKEAAKRKEEQSQQTKRRERERELKAKEEDLKRREKDLKAAEAAYKNVKLEDDQERRARQDSISSEMLMQDEEIRRKLAELEQREQELQQRELEFQMKQQKEREEKELRDAEEVERLQVEAEAEEARLRALEVEAAEQRERAEKEATEQREREGREAAEREAQHEAERLETERIAAEKEEAEERATAERKQAKELEAEKKRRETQLETDRLEALRLEKEWREEDLRQQRESMKKEESARKREAERREAEARFRDDQRRAEDVRRQGDPRRRGEEIPRTTNGTPFPPSSFTPGHATADSASSRGSTASNWSSTTSWTSSSSRPTSTTSSRTSASTSTTPRPTTTSTSGGRSASGGSFPQSTSPYQSSPLSEAEWARRQAEHAKKQQEQFRKEQERLEREKHAKTSRPLSKEETIQLFQEHDRQWARIKTSDELSWDSFPWPVFKRPFETEELTGPAIGAYVLSPYHPTDKTKAPKDRVKDHIKKWHPDRFETRILTRVRAEEKEKVKEGAGLVARNLNELLTRSNFQDMHS